MSMNTQNSEYRKSEELYFGTDNREYRHNWFTALNNVIDESVVNPEGGMMAFKSIVQNHADNPYLSPVESKMRLSALINTSKQLNSVAQSFHRSLELYGLIGTRDKGKSSASINLLSN